MKSTSMKVTDLKKIVDEYIENGFGNAAVVILNNAKNKDNNEHDVVENLKKKNVTVLASHRLFFTSILGPPQLAPLLLATNTLKSCFQQFKRLEQLHK